MLFASKYLNPQNDIAFKKIFGEEKNQDILIAMLNAVLKSQLHKPIKEVQFLVPYQHPKILAKKESIVDVLCRDRDGCQYVIEMQVAHSEGFEERAQYYASQAFVSQMGKGEKYQDLKEVIFLAFTNYNLFPRKKGYKSEHVTLDRNTYERDLDKISFTFIDLVKFDKQNRKKVEDLTLEEKFYYFLMHADTIKANELDKFVGKDKVIKKAFDVLERYYWTDEEFWWYQDEEKRVMDNKAVADYQKRVAREKVLKEVKEIAKREGKEMGMKEGKEMGMKEGKQQLANDLIKAGVSKDLIDSLLESKE